VPLPKNVTFVTLDVYGTLIDWEAGAHVAFQKEADREGLTVDRQVLVPLFVGIQHEIERGSYELYAEVMRRTAVRTANDLGWDIEPSRARFLPESIPRWPPFREANAQLERLRKQFSIGLLSNIDDKLLGVTRRHLRVDFDLVVTAQQVRGYKPDPAHFKECARRMGSKRGWVHIASGYDTDVEPCLKEKIPVIWVNRTGQKLDSGEKKPTAEVKNLREAVKLLGAG